MSTLLVLQHEDCEPLGFIEDSLRELDLTFQYIRPYAGDVVPAEMEETCGLIVLGGPQGAYEIAQYPYLADEIRLIQDAVRREIPVLGACLGAQLLAAALGARVYPGAQKEIGWYPVTLTEAAGEDPIWGAVASRFMALHWHGDVFDLPEGATRLASSEMTPNQAFRFGRSAYGIQWHMEMTEAIIKETARESEAWFRSCGIDPNEILGGVQEHLPNLSRVAGIVFRGWAKLSV
ncbi:MAG: gamma-glutamyl-gamma-aminobutyrate hydrolase family protein [Capsulimonas sp.]|uniref:type 1 glutamine amidotransferase n=1 Tax=Capsulimonas sp. TaxID=2494211 RepID=UPI003267376A